MSNQVAEVSSKYLAEAASNADLIGYKQTEVGVIPEDWLCEEIGSFKPFITSGSRGWAAYYSKYGSPFVRITNTTRKSIYLDLSDTKYVLLPDDSSEGRRTSLENGDVLISITADIGICSYVDDRLEKPAFINQHIALVRFDSLDIDSKFVAYYLSSDNVQKLFRSGSDQGAKAGMNLEGVRKIHFAVPPKPEQTAIANSLSDVDALVSELEKLIAKKQAIKTATMQQLLTGRTRLPQFALREDGTPKGTKPSEFGEIPEAWEVHSLSSICDVRDGTHDSPKYKDNGIPLVTSKNIVDDILDLSNVSLISPEDAFEIDKRSKVDKGDIIMSMIGTVGSAVLLLEEPKFCIKNVALFKPKKVSGEFLVQLIRSKIFQDYLEDSMDGGIQKFVSLGTLRNMEISLPSEQEQTAIATILSDMDAEIQALEQRLGKTRQIKQGMMQELLTGKTRLIKGGEHG